MKSINCYVAIMAGGKGTRFWPESRSALPKQFLDLLGTGKTLIQSTFQRFASIVPSDHIFIITSEEYRQTVFDQLPDINPGNCIVEPQRKNTAACAAYFAHVVHSIDPDAIIIMAPSDHLILEETAFAETVRRASAFAQSQPALITLGMKPSRADTGYGYIEFDGSDGKNGVFPVLRFTEKPERALAESFFASKHFLWNSGIFVWKVSSILEALEKYLPELNQLFKDHLRMDDNSSGFAGLKRVYAVCESISIDYGIMERADNTYVIPAEFGWSDLGTWQSAYEQIEKDKDGNAVLGQNVLLKETKDCVIKVPAGKMIVVQGVDDLIIVDTKDALLICRRNKEQEIKNYVAEVQTYNQERFV